MAGEDFPGELVTPLALVRAREQIRLALVACSAGSGSGVRVRMERLILILSIIDECLQWEYESGQTD